MRVLHFSSQPICDEQLMLDVELRAIADALLPGKVLKSTSLESVPQARPADVDVYLNTVRPDIVHFSCHGEVGRGLKLCDAYLEENWYSAKELAEALEGMGVKVVVLNACQAGEIADAIKPHVDVVISSKTDAKINDEHAIVFSEVFYRSLQVGLPVGKAFAAASRELNLIGFKAADAYEMTPREKALENQPLLSQAVDAGSESTGDEAPGARHRLRGAAARLESARFGAAQDARTNGWKLGMTFVVAGVLSVLSMVEKIKPDISSSQTPELSSSLSPEEMGLLDKVDQIYSSIVEGFSDWTVVAFNWMVDAFSWILEAFSWVQVNPWLLFTFFAAPPAIYLVEYFWLRRPLEEAERVAFGLALKASESVDPEIVVERVEALVKELDESNKAIFNVIREEKGDA